MATNPYAGVIFNPGRMVPPRPRGAAGIRGLGAPGTAPPRSLVRQLTKMDQIYDNAVKYEKFLNGMGFQAGFPQGPPTSPPPLTGNGTAFFNPNLRMMAPAPPHPLAFQPYPLYYN